MNAVPLGCLGSISSDSAQICVFRNRGIICWQDGQPSSKDRRDIVKDLSNAGLQLAILLPSRISGRELLIPEMSRCIIRACISYNFKVVTFHLQYDSDLVLEVGRQSRIGVRAAPVSPALVYIV